MFTATFSKSIWNGESIDVATSVVSLTREETLPFVPMPGIEFWWGYDLPCATLKSQWNFDENKFVCKLADEFPHSIGSDYYDFDWLVANAMSSGWTIVTKKPVEQDKSFWEENQ